MADKDGMERKVYLLPTELVGRIRAYQEEQNISSEVEAARRLLNEALQLRDNIEDILVQVKSRWVQDKDLRVINREILSNHALVEVIRVTDIELNFMLRNKDTGSIDRHGRLRKGTGDDQGFGYLHDWSPTPPSPPPSPKKQTVDRAKSLSPPAGPTGGWDAPDSSDLDDEIPF